jgi:hypothetical protein
MIASSHDDVRQKWLKRAKPQLGYSHAVCNFGNHAGDGTNRERLHICRALALGRLWHSLYRTVPKTDRTHTTARRIPKKDARALKNRQEGYSRMFVDRNLLKLEVHLSHVLGQAVVPGIVPRTNSKCGSRVRGGKVQMSSRSKPKLFETRVLDLPIDERGAISTTRVVKDEFASKRVRDDVFAFKLVRFRRLRRAIDTLARARNVDFLIWDQEVHRALPAIQNFRILNMAKIESVQSK